jgi:hypothetical protein
MQIRWFESGWGETLVRYLPVKRRYWIDLAILVVGLGLLYLFVQTGQLWSAPKRDAIEIDLRVAALPRYTLFSLIRGSLAYFVSPSRCWWRRSRRRTRSPSASWCRSSTSASRSRCSASCRAW